jgi:ubiquinone/menaquinone biosynthesis C-methylase UbiE
MPHAKDIKAHYDRLATAYEDRWPAYNEVQIQWVLDHWPEQEENASVIDLACGTGLMLEHIRKKAPAANLTGADISPNMLNHAKNRLPGATFIEGNIEDLESLSGLPQADVTLSLSVLHHLNNVEQHLQLLNSVTKPGGTIFLSDFARNGLAMNAGDLVFRLTQPFHRKAYSHSALTQIIQKSISGEIRDCAILRPDKFWRIQIFAIQKEA